MFHLGYALSLERRSSGHGEAVVQGALKERLRPLGVTKKNFGEVAEWSNFGKGARSAFDHSA